MQVIFSILLPLLLSTILSMIIIPRILVVTYRKKIFDYIDERKIHTLIVPRMGGFSFLPSILFAFFTTLGLMFFLDKDLSSEAQYILFSEFTFFFSGLVLLYLAGIKDDIIGLRSGSKLFMQIMAAGILSLSELYVNNLHGIFGIHEIPALIGVPFTILLVLFVINAINLIDGIDGLASGISGISLIALGMLLFASNQFIYAILAFACLGTIIPFFIYNVFGKAERCRKIFMGDTGSMILGYLISFLIVRHVSSTSDTYPCTDTDFVFVFSTILVVVLDAIRVMLVRTKRRRPIFTGDKNHIHHKLLAIGLTSRQTLLVILSMSAMFCILNTVLIMWININTILIIDVFVFTMINIGINKINKRS